MPTISNATSRKLLKAAAGKVSKVWAQTRYQFTSAEVKKLVTLHDELQKMARKIK